MLPTTIFLLANVLYLTLRVSPVSGSFPRPLSPEEEERMIARSLQGDTQARDILIQRNLRLVAHIVKKYYASRADQDDLISIGTIGLIKAVRSYQPDKKIKLATYAARCIENAILSQMRLWFLINPPRAEKHQNGVFWHKFSRMFISFVPLRTAM